jgi:flagellar assembly factor FliW
LKKWWYTFTLRISLQANVYMTQEDQVLVANVVVIHPTQKTMALNVINQLTNVVAKLSAIVSAMYPRKNPTPHSGPRSL